MNDRQWRFLDLVNRNICENAGTGGFVTELCLIVSPLNRQADIF